MILSLAQDPPAMPAQQQATNDLLPNMTQRQFLQRLRTDVWSRSRTVSVSPTESFLKRLENCGWVERRNCGSEQQVKLTVDGLKALRTPVRIY